MDGRLARRQRLSPAGRGARRADHQAEARRLQSRRRRRGERLMEWAEETIVRLRELWDEGHSTAQIAVRLGVSKNAVVGKAHRLDLPARPSPIKREGAPTPPSQPRPGRPRRLCPGAKTLPPLSSAVPTPNIPT